MRGSVSILGVLGCVALAGCGSPGPGPFAGTYTGSEMIMAMVTSPVSSQSTSMANVTTAITATTAAGADMVITVTDPTAGGGGCTLNAVRMGSSATLQANQSCTIMSGGRTLAAVFQSGSGAVMGAMLSMTFAGTFTGSESGVAFSGTFNGTLTGMRQ